MILRKTKTEKNDKNTEVRYMTGTWPLQNLGAVVTRCQVLADGGRHGATPSYAARLGPQASALPRDTAVNLVARLREMCRCLGSGGPGGRSRISRPGSGVSKHVSTVFRIKNLLKLNDYIFWRDGLPPVPTLLYRRPGQVRICCGERKCDLAAGNLKML